MAGVQSSRCRPDPEKLHGFRNARQIGPDNSLEAIDLPAAPALQRFTIKPPDPAKDVDGAHKVLGGKCRFSRPGDPVSE
jgi:hypothetical protein